MANLFWELDKLAKDSGLLLLPPDAFLKHPSLQKSLNGRDSLLRFAPEMDKLFLDPKPKATDKSMAEYCKRNEALLPEDRQNIHIGTDFEGPLDRLLTKIGEIDDLKQMIAKVEETTSAKIQNLEKKLEDAGNNSAMYQKTQFKLYSTNLMMKMVDMCYIRKHQKLPASSDAYRRYTQASKLIGRDDFEKDHDLSLKYHDELSKLPKRIVDLNAAAHDTEYEFAVLLLSTRDEEPGRYEFWSGLYPFCFGKTVEEIAAQEDEV